MVIIYSPLLTNHNPATELRLEYGFHSAKESTTCVFSLFKNNKWDLFLYCLCALTLGEIAQNAIVYLKRECFL